MPRHAVVVLGLDGMSLNVLFRLIDLGVMPYVKHLVQKSFVKDLNVDLPFTLSSWTSISTGCNPGKHGIFDCLLPQPGGEPRLVTREFVERPTISEIVVLNGLKAVTINVPMTYPPAVKKNHIAVSGWTFPKLVAWPSSELETVKKILRREGPPPPVRTVEDRVEQIVESVERRCELLEYMYMHRDWNLFYAVIPESDWVFHIALREIIDAKGVGRLALRIFEKIDKLIQSLHESAPSNTLFIICSDHGFMEAHTSLNINVMLEKMGFLKSLIRKLSLRTRVIHWLVKLMPSWLKSRLKYGTAWILLDKVIDMRPFETGRIPIDYVNSRAYATIAYNIYVNPSLPPKNREEIRKEILRALEKYRYMFDVIEYGERYFHGPYVSRAPSIVSIPKEGYNVSTRLAYRNVVEKGKWYVHSTRGMVLLHAIDSDAELIPRDDIKNVDIAPSVLAWLNLPLDPDMDGAPLVKVEKPKFRRYGPAYRAAKAIHKT